MTVGASPVEACFTVKGLEYVEVAKLTPAKARERKVAIPNGKRTFGCCGGLQSPKSNTVTFQVDLV